MKARVLAPIAILAAGVAIIWLLVATRPVVDTRPIVVPRPIVRVETARAGPVRLTVDAQGTVIPRRQSSLVSQVAGEVVWTSPSLVPGGFFEAGEPLLRVDRVDYEAELEGARASVARAESEAQRAAKDLDRQRQLAGRSVSSEARIDDAENADHVARAGLREARARLGQAERDLERTELRAPYLGRVRSEMVDVGQYVSRGAVMAEVYAVDYAEVRLPVPDRELRFLDLPLSHRGRQASGSATPDGPAGDEATSPPGPTVELRAEFAGRDYAWQGHIVRTEGEIDPRSRMVTVVARVEDPYGQGGAAVASDAEPGDLAERPPLAVGLFVSARIAGIELDDAYVISRSALRGDADVFVVDAEDRLRLRAVQVIRRERDHVVVGDGLRDGDRVCVSPIPGAVDGMQVEIGEEAGAIARSGA